MGIFLHNFEKNNYFKPRILYPAKILSSFEAKINVFTIVKFLLLTHSEGAYWKRCSSKLGHNLRKKKELKLKSKQTTASTKPQKLQPKIKEKGIISFLENGYYRMKAMQETIESNQSILEQP